MGDSQPYPRSNPRLAIYVYELGQFWYNLIGLWYPISKVEVMMQIPQGLADLFLTHLAILSPNNTHAPRWRSESFPSPHCLQHRDEVHIVPTENAVSFPGVFAIIQQVIRDLSSGVR